MMESVSMHERQPLMHDTNDVLKEKPELRVFCRVFLGAGER